MHAAANVSERAGATAACAQWARARAAAACWLLAVVIAVLPLVLANNYFYEVAILVALNAIVCVGLNLLIGYAGQISLGHAGFFALGRLRQRDPGGALRLAGWLALPAGAAPRSACWPARRPADAAPEGPLPGDGHARPRASSSRSSSSTEDRMTGGPDGMAGAAARAVRLDGARASTPGTGSPARCCWLTVWLALNLIESPIGRALRALHGSEVAAETVGIDSGRYKLQGLRACRRCSPPSPAR